MQESKTTPTSPPSNHKNYEATDAKVSYIVIVAVATVVMVLMALPVVSITNAYFKDYIGKAQPLSPLAENPTPPEPRLLVHEKVDFQRLMAEQETIANEYRYINKQEGIVRIPVDRAMGLLLDPSRPKQKTEMPGNGLPSEETAPKPGEKAPS